MTDTNTTTSEATTVPTPSFLTSTQIPIQEELDIPFVVALACFGAGAVFLIVAYVRLAIWFIHFRKQRKYSKWWIRQLEHQRYIEEYSIRTADMASIRDSWPNLNEGFTDDNGNNISVGRHSGSGGDASGEYTYPNNEEGTTMYDESIQGIQPQQATSTIGLTASSAKASKRDSNKSKRDSNKSDTLAAL